MDEKLRILKMVEEGTVTAEEGAELMAALSGGDTAGTPATVKNGYEKKMFRILVDNTSGEGDKVKIQFPVGAVRRILKATGKLPIPEKDLEGIDLTEMMEAISECLEEEIEGDFINVSSTDGTTVRIFVDN